MTLLSDDIKKKLKVAMTAKLEEMGVQVERELPDYVLSMVSNNKDRDYIARNLSVFMGGNSRFFSDWLHNLVERIAMQQRPAPITAAKVGENVQEKAAKVHETAKRRKRRSDTTPPGRKTEGKSPEKKSAQQREDHSRRGRSHRNKSRRGRSRSRSRSCEAMDTSQPGKHVASTVTRRQQSPDNRRVVSSVTVKRHLPEKDSQPRLFSRAIRDMTERDGFGRNSTVRVEMEASYEESPERPVTVRLGKKLENGDYGFCKKFARKIVIEDDDDKAELQQLPGAAEGCPSEGNRVFHVTSVEAVESPHNLSQSSNVKTRCKFWPGCEKNGCTYTHPTKECTTFPHCRFGADCVFIHPPCRYANLCYNEHCTYTHAKIELLDKLVQELAEEKEKRSSQRTEVPLTMCHFAGRCKSQTCEYRHPPVCRYSGRCKNPQCQFYHGPLGNIQQHYSWRAIA